MSTAIPHHGLRGAHTEQAALIGLRFQARLKLSSHKRSLSALAGPYRASFRGRGMDFEEVRNYQPGDDVRSIDWRVTARTGDAHTKVFKEERERPVFILTDQRQPMYFGSQRCFKSVLAAEVASLLAWSALKQNDRVGGLVMGTNDVVEVKPKRSKSSVLRFLHSLHEYNHALGAQRGFDEQNKTSLSSALEDSRRLNKPGSAIFIISDFHDFDEKSSKQLFHLAQHNEVTAFIVSDQLEQQLPPSGSYEVTDGANKGLLNTQNKEIRTKYQQFFAQWQSDLSNNLAKSGVPLVALETGCDALNELMKYYTYQRGHN
ncbi:MAG: DUF58 domain-containing protein [Pseudomonadales bacterium]